MLLKAKRKIATATKTLPAGPISPTSAACVSRMPDSEASGTPPKRMMKAVQVQITSVSVKTPRVWISPCLTGCDTWAVAATFGAEPMPASLLNRPRLMPCMSAAPAPPPIACSQPKALATISSTTSGNRRKLKSTTPSARTIYPSAMTGTTTPLTRAIRWMPPKMTSSVSSVRPAPTQWWAKPKAPSQAAQIVLLCTELKAKPNVTEISTAKRTPIQRLPSPRSM